MDNIDESKFIWWFKLSYIKLFDFFLFIKIDGKHKVFQGVLKKTILIFFDPMHGTYPTLV